MDIKAVKTEPVKDTSEIEYFPDFYLNNEFVCNLTLRWFEDDYRSQKAEKFEIPPECIRSLEVSTEAHGPTSSFHHPPRRKPGTYIKVTLSELRDSSSPGLHVLLDKAVYENNSVQHSLVLSKAPWFEENAVSWPYRAHNLQVLGYSVAYSHEEHKIINYVVDFFLPGT